MSRDLEGAVLLVMAVVLARITFEGTYLAYVKASLLIPLLLTTGMLAFLGLATFRSVPVTVGSSGDDTDGSLRNAHGPPRSGLLLLAPVIVLVLIAPPPLGSFAADRGSSNSFVADIAQDLPALPPGSDPLPLTVSETVLRTFAEGDASVQGRAVVLEGFVVPREDGNVGLSRFAIACCAADASPREVRLADTGFAPAADTWLRVTAVWEGQRTGSDDRYPVMRVLEATEIDAPREPYEPAAF